MKSRRVSRQTQSADLDLFAADVEPTEASDEPPRVSEGRRSARREPELSYDAYPGETARSAVAVSILTQTARDVIEGAFIPLWVRGEITDFKTHRNGNWYFCLRDHAAQLRCVVWSRDKRAIPAEPDEGMQVAAFGRLTVYPARGEMQFSVLRIEAEGDGLRRKALELTVARLEKDGLLAPERKRALPRFPRVIAVITSPDGAALHDVIAVARRRSANIRIVVVPAAVQGDAAPAELCDAIEQVNRWGEADVVIIGRGGGAREDLSAFNDERVARAVAACRVPVISAVGHEIDMSICDLVADHRAPTPSAAAESATRARAELDMELRKLALRLTGGTRQIVRDRADQLRHLGRDVAVAGTEQLARRRALLQETAGRLHALSPLATLARGYALARRADGTTLSSASQFSPGMPFELTLRDGVVSARTEPGAERTQDDHS